MAIQPQVLDPLNTTPSPVEDDVSVLSTDTPMPVVDDVSTLPPVDAARATPWFNDFYTVATSALQSVRDFIPFNETFKENLQLQQGKGKYDTEAGVWVDETANNIAGVLEETPYLINEDVEATAKATVAAYETLNQEIKVPEDVLPTVISEDIEVLSTEEEATIDRTPSFFESRQAIEAVSLRMQLLQEIARHPRADLTFSDHVRSLGTMLIHPLHMHNVKEHTGDWFGNVDTINGYVEAFQSLPPEQQLEKFPALVDELLGEGKDNVIGVDILQRMITPGSEFTSMSNYSDFWAALFFLIDAPVLAKGATYLGKAAPGTARLAGVYSSAKIQDMLDTVRSIPKSSTSTVRKEKVVTPPDVVNPPPYTRGNEELVVNIDDLRASTPKGNEELTVNIDELSPPLPKSSDAPLPSGPIRTIEVSPSKSIKEAFEDTELGRKVTTLANALANNIQRSLAQSSLPAMFAKLKNKHAAAGVATEGLQDPNVAKGLNMSEHSLQNTVMPFDVDLLDPAYVEGLSSLTLNNLKAGFDSIDALVGRMLAQEFSAKEGALNVFEKMAQEAKAIKELNKTNVTNVRVAEGSRTEKGFTLLHDLEDATGKVVSESLAINYSMKDVGTYDVAMTTIWQHFIKSPTAFASRMKELYADVQTSQRIELNIARTQKQFNKLVDEAVSRLGNPFRKKTKEEMAKINKALQDGDEYINLSTGSRGKVWTPEELRTDFSLTDAGIEAYYLINRLNNNLFRMHNHIARNEKVLRGVKAVGSPLGANLQGTVARTAKEISKMISEAPNRQVVLPEIVSYGNQVASQGKIIKLSDVKEILENNPSYVLVKLDSLLPLKPSGGKVASEEINHVSYIVAKSDEISELPEVVLAWLTGHVPRMYNDAIYFVKENIPLRVDGKISMEWRKNTLGFFDNVADADKFVLETAEAAVKEERYEDLPTALANIGRYEDRGIEIEATAFHGAKSTVGSLYGGSRSQDAILFGIEGERADRINPSEALLRHIGFLSRSFNINEWRTGMEQRWLNTVRQRESGKHVKHFGTLPADIAATGEGATLKAMADQIRDWQGFPTLDERAFTRHAQTVYEWALKSNSKAVQHIIGGMAKRVRDTDPFALSRAVTFHSTLGLFNPIQYWTQAQSASVVMSLFPKKGLYFLRKQEALRRLAHNVDPTDAEVAVIAKEFGYDLEEFTALVNAWNKSGLQDSLLITADHAAITKGYGMALAAMNKQLEKGLVFYKGGELLGRRVSFIAAFDEHLAAIAKTKKGDSKGYTALFDEDLKLVVDRTNDLLLNMGKANAARWQKGIFAPATQFWQITSKSAESLLGLNKAFTRQERARIMWGQLALYGAAGVPVVGTGLTTLSLHSAGFSDTEIDEMPNIVKKTLSDGLWGTVSWGLFGADMDIGSRGSLASGVDQMMENFLGADASVVSRMLGVGGSVYGRVVGDWVDTLKRYMLVDKGFASTAEFAANMSLGWVSAFSTLNNLSKAEAMWRTGTIKDRSGNILSDQIGLAETVGQALGLTPSARNRYYDLVKREEIRAQFIKDLSDVYVREVNRHARLSYYGVVERTDDQRLNSVLDTIQAWVDPEEYKAIARASLRRLDNKAEDTKYYLRYLRNNNDNVVSRLLDTKAAFYGVGSPNLHPNEEEEK